MLQSSTTAGGFQLSNCYTTVTTLTANYVINVVLGCLNIPPILDERGEFIVSEPLVIPSLVSGSSIMRYTVKTKNKVEQT